MVEYHRKGRLHSPEKFLHLLTKLPARSKTHTLLNEYLDPKYQIEHIPDHALDVSVSGAGGSYHAEDLDAHSAAKFVDRFLSGSIAPQSSGKLCTIAICRKPLMLQYAPVICIMD